MADCYFITTFGCQQNEADSERIASFYEARGFVPAKTIEEAQVIILNTCVVRERAAEKVFGLVRNIRKGLKGDASARIVVTGCLIGAASRVPGGKMMKQLRARLPDVDFLPLEEVGFEYAPKRTSLKSVSIPISNGCNNYCSYCIVPFSRGKERSRPFADIIVEVQEAVRNGAEEVLLLGQNVNSYGADLLLEKIGEKEEYILPDGRPVKPVMVKHLSRHRIPTLFPHLLESVAMLPQIKKVSFVSSNPWDFSDDLIDVIARYPSIDRLVHLPVQAGSDSVLKRMNRWYTQSEYLALINRIQARIPEVKFTTDIIVGFPGETAEEFEETKKVARLVKFEKAYIAWYSPRPGTVGMKDMVDDVPFLEKKRRHRELDELVLTLSGNEWAIKK
ncbi:MAG: MiaB/RimO family radical SAM methylthiotransferase [Candidatus Moranbacteria bacterium]|jgi:tRNA-2-methylthio-N6-dimethylallyladenosine synthase|nr:MiaB/RimO family radical SAM methylthiotransferase [Candidatus Moranbacteria bacterium]MBP9801776.1 MiaB/RimO family radical SAM methylthiotransferase [Candidatus Moranbacteria bacterium]